MQSGSSWKSSIQLSDLPWRWLHNWETLMHQDFDKLFASRKDGHIRVVAEGIQDHNPRMPDGDHRFPEVLVGAAWLTDEEYEKGFFLAKDGENWVFVHRTIDRTWTDTEIWRTAKAQKELDSLSEKQATCSLYQDWSPSDGEDEEESYSGEEWLS